MTTFEQIREHLDHAEREASRIFDLLEVLGRVPENPHVSLDRDYICVHIFFKYFENAYRDSLGTLLNSLNLTAEITMGNASIHLHYRVVTD